MSHFQFIAIDIVPHHSSELALPWDPLASSYHVMAAVQRKVVCLQCPLEIEDVASSDNAMETFSKDASTKALGISNDVCILNGS